MLTPKGNPIQGLFMNDESLFRTLTREESIQILDKVAKKQGALLSSQLLIDQLDIEGVWLIRLRDRIKKDDLKAKEEKLSKLMNRPVALKVLNDSTVEVWLLNNHNASLYESDWFPAFTLSDENQDFLISRFTIS